MDYGSAPYLFCLNEIFERIGSYICKTIWTQENTEDNLTPLQQVCKTIGC